jgi:hypothetical protein
LALAAFVCTSTLSVAILWPHPWQLTASSSDVVETYIEGERSAPPYELHRDLSIHMHESYVENQAGVEYLAALLQLASGLLTLQVVLWIIALALNV